MNWVNGEPQKFSKIRVLKVNYFHLLRKKTVPPVWKLHNTYCHSLRTCLLLVMSRQFGLATLWWLLLLSICRGASIILDMNTWLKINFFAYFFCAKYPRINDEWQAKAWLRYTNSDTIHYSMDYRVQTPNEGINGRNLKCLCRMWQTNMLWS